MRNHDRNNDRARHGLVTRAYSRWVHWSGASEADSWKNHVEVEALARLTNGSLSFHEDLP